jgi:hypothetical protein
MIWFLVVGWNIESVNLPDKMVNLWIFTVGLSSSGCQPHTSSIWPWSGAPKVRLYDTFLGGLRQHVTAVILNITPYYCFWPPYRHKWGISCRRHWSSSPIVTTQYYTTSPVTIEKDPANCFPTGSQQASEQTPNRLSVFWRRNSKNIYYRWDYNWPQRALKGYLRVS